MPQQNPNESPKSVSVHDAVSVLLQQFVRLLKPNGIDLTHEKIQLIASCIAEYDTNFEGFDSLQEALQELVNESVEFLQSEFGLTFKESLATDMGDIAGWQTTAEFLELANRKSNAELRISAGATLLVSMEKLEYVPYLIAVIDHDDGVMDVDARFARSILLHVRRISPEDENWFEAILQWWQSQDNTAYST